VNTFLFENHDEAYFIWKKLGVKNEILIHIDAHLDFDWIHKQSSQNLLNVSSLSNFKRLLTSDIPFNLNDEEGEKNFIHIGNYIYPAMQEGLVKTFYWVLPDPIWKGSEQRLLKSDLACNFRKYHKGDWQMDEKDNFIRFLWADKEMIVLGLDDLPAIKTPVLLDIDVDFLVTRTVFALNSKKELKNRFPWMWPNELVNKIHQKLASKVTTIAYSVEGGYTPIAFKFFGDELKEILTGAYSHSDPFYLLRRRAVEGQLNKDWPSSINPLLEAQKLRPEEASVAWALAESYWALGDKAKATNNHKLAKELDPSYASEFNSYGIRLEMLKKRKEALKEFEKMTELDPLDPRMKCNAAWQHLSYKRFEEALKLFEEAFVLDNSCGDAHLGLGFIWMQQKKFEKASQAFEKAIQYKTQNRAVHYWLGSTLAKQGFLDQAIREYNRFIRSGTHNIWVSLKLGWIYLRKGATYKAKWEIERLLRVLKALLQLRMHNLDWNFRKLKWKLS